MKIYLVRHGTAEHPAVDPRRPLSREGRREVEAVAEALRARGVTLAWIVHSPRARAAETAALLGDALAAGVAREERGDLLPLGPVENLAVDIAMRKGDGMAVGHMPFLGDLACRLAGPRLADYPQFPAAGVMCLERIEDGGWVQQWMLGP